MPGVWVQAENTPSMDDLAGAVAPVLGKRLGVVYDKPHFGK